MADIDVVPKHRSLTWLWLVIAIIVVALIIWAIAAHSHSAASIEQIHNGVLALLTSAVPEGVIP